MNARCEGHPVSIRIHPPDNKWELIDQSCGWEGEAELIRGLLKPCPDCGGRLVRASV